MKTTGNIAVDMVNACLTNYRLHYRRLKVISLSHNYWKMFSDHIKKVRPEFEFEDAIEMTKYKVTVRKGHAFMRENLEMEFHDSVKAEA
jgi:hypothetical protein